MRRGVAIEIELHLARLREGMGILAIPMPHSDEELVAAIAAVVAANAPDDAAVRITVSRGAPTGRGLLPAGWRELVPTIVIQAWPHVPVGAEVLARGVRAVIASGRRDPAHPLATVKTTSRADHVHAKLEAERSGADDAITLTIDGHVAEATTANVALIVGKQRADAAARRGDPGRDHARLAPAPRGGGGARPRRVRGVDHARRPRRGRRGAPLLVRGRLPAARGPRRGADRRRGAGAVGRPPPGGARGLDRGRRRAGRRRRTAYTPPVTRDELIDRTKRLIAEGDRLEAPVAGCAADLAPAVRRDPREAWGSMDRYHLAWLSVGKPKEIVRGRPMTSDEEAAYVREVARQKTAALRMSLDAVERQGMPFRGESGGVGAGQGMARRPRRAGGPASTSRPRRTSSRPGSSAAREEAARHDEADAPAARAPAGEDAAMTGPRTPAVGGARDVPVPDPVARDYLLLALRLDQHIPGLVDGYFGPADLKVLVDAEQPRSPAGLVDDAAALRARLPAEVAELDRRRWLDVQLVALEAQARALAGDGLPYLEHVSACFDYEPTRTPEAVFDAAAAELDALLPGAGPLARPDRRLGRQPHGAGRPRPRVVDALLPDFRRRAAALFGLPEGEGLVVSLVRDQPWSGYNWYDGGLRSRVDLNTDLPIRAADLLAVLPHETYPGHHLEHAWHEAHLVDGLGRMEASILGINTPECLLSEGLADLGRRFAVPPDDEVAILAEVFSLAGLPNLGDAAEARAAAERQVAISRALDRGPRRGRECRAPAPRRRRPPRGGARLPGTAPAFDPRARRQAPRVHLPSAVADLRLRLLRGRTAAPALARDGPLGGAARALPTAAAGAADPVGDRRGDRRPRRRAPPVSASRPGPGARDPRRRRPSRRTPAGRRCGSSPGRPGARSRARRRRRARSGCRGGSWPPAW